MVAETNPPINEIVELGIIPAFVDLLKHNNDSRIQVISSTRWTELSLNFFVVEEQNPSSTLLNVGQKQRLPNDISLSASAVH